jgi:hypothetical protein
MLNTRHDDDTVSPSIGPVSLGASADSPHIVLHKMFTNFEFVKPTI